MPHVHIDGNEAAARVAYALSEVIAIYPITPASPMGEFADAWSAKDQPNLWGSVPRVVELQSEGGAAGALHGAIQKGALATTFTASQGLLLMLPNMYKIAGELTPAVIHVAARTIATHALSIFGDHSDVMAARPTGWAMLASNSPQEAQDMAAVAHAATLASRVPFLHFFDGFRTSHEINVVDTVDDDTLRAMINDTDVIDHRVRGLTPDAPVLRGTAQNPDVFFQAREAANPFHDAVPAIVQDTMDRFATLTGRAYRLVEYTGAPDADRVVILMGSGVGAATEAVEALVADGQKVGVLTVRLYRPFPTDALLGALPDTVQRIAVLDRTKEPGATGDPLLQDVVTALADATTEGRLDGMPRVTGGRYGLSSKEFTPAMVAAVLDDLAGATPRRRFTVGITDDVTRLSIPPLEDFAVTPPVGTVQALFYGLGADGTVGANKNTVKIVGEHSDLHAQGYFVYDSKKSGAQTVSHLRFSPEPIRSTYLIDRADFVACHQFGFLERTDVLDRARSGATVLLNSPYGPDEVWDHLPVEVQSDIIDRDLQLWVIDAYSLARDQGLGGRINTVMQPCFFELTDLLPRDQAMAGIREEIEATYGKRGPEVVRRNLEAVSRALDELHRVEVPDRVTADVARFLPADHADDDFVTRVTARILAGHGDQLPVSALPCDGTFPTGTAKWEQRSIAQELPIWDPDLCIDCGKCAIVCPHAAIRLKVFDPHNLDAPTPEFFPFKDFNSRDLDGYQLTVQVAPDDCTGCGVCVEACPARSKEQVGHKAIDMEPAIDHRDLERQRWDVFTDLPELDRTAIDHGNVKNTQLLQPLFEFSGACAGCGETPYLKLMTQLFGDRAIVANATGCSSIYGGNLPTTPWTVDANGRGPAWANSLFEDNAEFGLGIRVGLDHQVDAARLWVERLADRVGTDLAEELLAADQSSEQGIADQRERVATLEQTVDQLLANGANDLDPNVTAELTHLRSLAGALVRKNVWIVGGDGWAYDIGFGGLDHLLGSGLDVNILVLDTEVYSNTGGQASKATARGAVAKFATAGKATPKKDLGMLATQYGNVYIAQVAMGANDMQTVRAFREAEAWPGPSLILAYSTCIAHGVDMSQSMVRMREAVQTGYWPLYRYRPGEEEGTHPFQLDSKRSSRPVTEFMDAEARFAMLWRSNPERAAQLAVLAQSDVDERWNYYEQLADVERQQPSALGDEDDDLSHTPHATVVAPDRAARPDRPAGSAAPARADGTTNGAPDKEPGDA